MFVSSIILMSLALNSINTPAMIISAFAGMIPEYPGLIWESQHRHHVDIQHHPTGLRDKTMATINVCPRISFQYRGKASR